MGNKKTTTTKFLVSFKVGIMTIFAVSLATTVSILNNEHLDHDHDSLLVKSGDALNEYNHYNISNNQTRILHEEDHVNNNNNNNNDDDGGGGGAAVDENNKVIIKVSGEEAQKLIEEMDNGVMIHFRVLNYGDGNAVVEFLRDL